MVSFLAANRLEEQLASFYPRQHLSYVFEFRIKEDNDQVDLAMAFAEKNDLLFLQEEYAKKPNQKEVVDWLGDCFKLSKDNQQIKSFWIEADLNGTQNDQIPSLFVSPKQQFITFDEICYFVSVLSLSSKNEQEDDLLKECLEALEEGQYIEHLGVMHSRGKTKTTRMYIRGFDSKSLFTFLNRINWPGNKEVLATQLIYMNQTAYISVAVEYNKDWLPTIGVEFHLKNGSQYCEAFLSILQKSGLCTTQRVAAIMDVLRPQKIKSNGATYKRGLSHFKINIDKDGAIEPKVYVQLIPDYLSILGF
ncbi:hypothetical protein ABW636_09585 [Aquimarina sp. 2201CG1-2-11]|uniref:hypothetical protein n=1 Tax=Aquimarina discodermiae TaxID=3231043 RepID=UPI003461CD49